MNIQQKQNEKIGLFFLPLSHAVRFCAAKTCSVQELEVNPVVTKSFAQDWLRV